MNSTKKIALVTGGNRGIGLEICRQLSRHGFIVLLGSRDLSHGEAAARELQDEGLDVRPVQVDMNDAATFRRLYDLIACDYGHLDALINNAGLVLVSDWEYKATDVPIQTLRDTLESNFFGLVELTQILLPLIRKSSSGRIVNQSSRLGSLTLHSTPDSGLEDLKPFAYNTSKTAVNAFTVHLAAATKGTRIKVNSANPGDVATAANPSGMLTVEEGARTAVWLATLPDDGPSGGKFHGMETTPW
jgi:NAD(P)-dependent dehydrogenase (short-subunit alcohol dehydrogenase family)